MEGVMPGRKIDLSRFEAERDKKKKEKISRPEDHLANLKEQLSSLAQEVNGEFGEFLHADGSIIMAGRDLLNDAVLVEQQEEGFALEAGKSREDWRREKELNPATLTKMALTF